MASPEKRIALVTSREYAGLTEDDRLALAPLRRRGINAEPALWNDPEVAWEAFDQIILRSCWDYHLASESFSCWLDALDRRSLPLSNPAQTVRWNMEKTYLKELEQGGVAIPRTFWAGKDAVTSLTDILKESGFERSVVKPTISASAYETWVVTRNVTDADEARFRLLVASSGVMVQQFMEPVTAAGEWSLIFFSKRFSHAVVKRPKQGDFRVQSEFGGTVEAVKAPKALIDQATDIIRSVRGRLLYGRVDGIVEHGRLILMELELIEPALFLHADPDAPDRFADAIAAAPGEGDT